MRHKNNLTVTVLVSDLLVRLRENLANHSAMVLKAREGFEKEAIETLENNLKDLNQGRLDKVAIYLEGVADHSRDYQRVIGMLEMHQDTTIELEADDYARYVQDDWDWKEQWFGANSKYLG